MKFTRRDFIKLVTGAVAFVAGLPGDEAAQGSTNLREGEGVFPFVEIVNEEGTGGIFVPPDFDIDTLKAKMREQMAESDFGYMVPPSPCIKMPAQAGLMSVEDKDGEIFFSSDFRSDKVVVTWEPVMAEDFAEAIALAEDRAIMEANDA